MRRRKFIGLTGTAALSLSRSVNAQTSTGLLLVGLMLPFKADSEYARQRMATIRQGLQDVGFIEGKNYTLSARFAEGDLSRWPTLAKELATLNPRLIIVVGYGVGVVHGLLPAMPIVFTAIAADPIATGLAKSYAQPGGMVTGNVMNALGGEETVTQKRIGLFKQIVPTLARLGMIAPEPVTPLSGAEKEALQKLAPQLSFDFVHYEFRTLDDLEGAFEAGRRDNVSAFYISGDTILISNLARVMALVEASGKPTVGPYPDWGRGGLLLSYSTDPMEGFRRAGAYAAKILNGARPGELPIEQASKFVMVINQKTAKALGIVVPPAVLAFADEVIE